MVLRLPCPATIDVGRLGRARFPAGWYAYTGSARGPGGLAARISRHLRAPNRLHWHVDYLRAKAQPAQIWYAAGARRRECAWAQVLTALPGASVPVPHFGASDCYCPAHLVHFAAPPDLERFARAVGERVSQERLDA